MPLLAFNLETFIVLCDPVALVPTEPEYEFVYRFFLGIFGCIWIE